MVIAGAAAGFPCAARSVLSEYTKYLIKGINCGIVRLPCRFKRPPAHCIVKGERFSWMAWVLDSSNINFIIT